MSPKPTWRSGGVTEEISGSSSNNPRHPGTSYTQLLIKVETVCR